MTDTAYDFLVIGAGSGGVRCARVAAQAGAKVAIVESTHWGGTCVNKGCVPKKLMFYAASAGHVMKHADGFGWESVTPKLDWKIFNERRDAEITRLEGIYHSILEKNGVDLFEGFASFEDPYSVKVTPTGFGTNKETVTIKASKILIATGGVPHKLDIEGADLTITSDDMFKLPEKPKEMLVIGAGYIGVEFAGVMAGLGSHVDICYRADLPLRGFDEELRQKLAENFKNAGISAHPGFHPVKIEKQGSRKKVTFENGKQIVADQVLMATGRTPAIESLGLDKAGVETEKGHVKVDQSFTTSQKHIYAIGDVIGWIDLTPVAIAQGQMLADNLFGKGEGVKWSFNYVPKAVFAHPPMASVGLTEEEASALGDVNIYTTQFTPMSEALWKEGKSKIFMKLVVDPKSDKLLGAHMIGEEGPDMIQLMATMIQCGVTKKQLDQTVALHPSSAEEMVTMRTLTRTVKKQS